MKVVNLMLGSACNLHCEYCLQTGQNVPANHKADEVAFAEKLVAFLRQKQTSHSQALIELPDVIAFWGGEPLLYWKTITSLVATFDRLSFSPKRNYLFTTNGKTLSDEYVEFANEHRFWTTISSHDWNFDDDVLRRIFRLRNWSFSVIIHRQHLNFFSLRDRFYRLWDRFGVPPRFYLHFLRANDGCSPEFYLRKEDVDYLLHHLQNDVLPLVLSGDDWATVQCRQLLVERFKEKQKGNEGGKCVRSDRLAIDLHGNVYACHHNYDANNVTQNLFRKTIPIVQKGRTENLSPQRFSESKECQACSYFSECHGGCYLSKTHDVDCYLTKRLAPFYDQLAEILHFDETFSETLYQNPLK